MLDFLEHFGNQNHTSAWFLFQTTDKKGVGFLQLSNYGTDFKTQSELV